jgi:hypothetical protein
LVSERGIVMSVRLRLEHLMYDTVDGAILAVHVPSGRRFGMAGPAATIWASLAQGLDPLAALRSEYGEVPESDLVQFMDHLVAEGLAVSGGPVTAPSPLPRVADPPHVARDAASSLVCAAARYHLGTGDKDDVEATLAALEDSAEVSTAALREGMHGVLTRVLDDLQVDAPLGPCRAEMRRTFERNAGYLGLLHWLGDDLDFEVVVLKGGALLEDLYRGYAACRPMSDIDLLVRPEHAHRLYKLLHEHGFEGDAILRRGELEVDVHTDLVSATRIRSRALAFQFDPWRDSRPWRAALRRLAPLHEYAYLAVHGVKHSFGRLYWLMDLALLQREVSGFTRDPWQAMMRATNTTRVLAYTQELLGRILHVAATPALSVATSSLERRFLQAATVRRVPEGLGEIVCACSIPSLVDRARYVWELCFPDRHVLAATFQGTPAWLLYPKRCSQLVGKAWRVGTGAKNGN